MHFPKRPAKKFPIIDSENIKKIKKAWRESGNYKAGDGYRGLEVIVWPFVWRYSHTYHFPFWAKLNPFGSKRDEFSKEALYVPGSVVELLLTGQITMEELETVITGIIHDLDAPVEEKLHAEESENESNL